MSWYNIHKIAQSKGIISFDFDDTLTKPEYDGENGTWASRGPNEEIIAKMRKYKEDGYGIVIITSRLDKDMEEVAYFVQKYDLPVDEIYNTNGSLKGQQLKQLGVLMHFDDCPDEIRDAKEYNVDVKRVWHPLDIEMEK